MGINVHMKGDLPLACDWTDLTRVLGTTPSRNRVIIAVLNALAPMLIRFQQQGLAPFLPLWQQHDVLVNKSVQLVQPQGVKIGTARGINERGELCVQLDEGLIAVRSGEVSVLSGL
jgi:BirA family biotin operon repressor/biotin-[acetyl-CoA-carboxylase] ligase